MTGQPSVSQDAVEAAAEVIERALGLDVRRAHDRMVADDLALSVAAAVVAALDVDGQVREAAEAAWDKGWSSGFYKAQARYSDDTEDASEVTARNPYAAHDPAATARASAPRERRES